MFPILDRCEHCDYSECIACTNQRHAEAHPVPVDGCGICRFSMGTIQLSPKATPNKRSPVPPRRPSNSWEKGVARDSRGMPLYEDGRPISVKEYAERRHSIEEKRRRLHHIQTASTQE